MGGLSTFSQKRVYVTLSLMDTQRMKHWWRIEWGRTVAIGAICCVFNLVLYKSQVQLLDWLELGAGVSAGVLLYDFLFVRKATFQQRLERISLLQALLTGVFAAVFSKATH